MNREHSVPPARPSHPGGLPVYRVPTTGLQMGPSLGNASCWVNTKGNGDVECLYSVDADRVVAETLGLRVLERGGGEVLPDAPPHVASPDGARLLLNAEGEGEFVLHPAYWRYTYHLPRGLQVTQTVFVPVTEGEQGPGVVLRVEVTNHGPEERALSLLALASLRGSTEVDVRTRWDGGLGALAAWNESHPNWVRLFGSSVPPTHSRVTGDASLASEPLQILSDTATNTCVGDPIGLLDVPMMLPPEGTQQVTFCLVFSSQGQEAASHLYRACQDESLLERTVQHVASLLDVCQVLSPDPVVNDGALWSKVDMLRVMERYPQGWAFTNDPGGSTNVVVRDSCWFVYGCDYFLPAFSRSLLEGIAARQEESGLIVEYWNGMDGRTEDYGLNINDNTPLFILALCHYWRLTGDRATAERLYPAALRAARYMLSQRDQRGLIFVRAPGVGVHGIAGWRNIIPNKQINGAVTEVNSEGAASLLELAGLARSLGHTEEGEELQSEGAALKDAINRELYNPGNGFYYLNIDMEGTPHTDMSSDQVFPVMFGVAPEDVGYRIISRLTRPDFSNASGIRTVPQTSLQYAPYGYSGLLGGVWPGVTWWCAYASVRYHSSFHVNALRASYRQYSVDPAKNNTVPGQFSEWFDGESMVNLGMRLSPWEPPRFLWATVEGLCGVHGRDGQVGVNPRLPPDWQWIGIRRMAAGGRTVTWFAARQGDGIHLFADGPLHTESSCEEFDTDITPQVAVDRDTIHHLAFARGDDMLVCLGNEGESPSAAAVRLPVDQSSRYSLCLYESTLSRWTRTRTVSGADLCPLLIDIEAGGFRLLRIRRV